MARDIRADLVLVDDWAAREEAVLHGLRLTGTLGVLRLSAERELIDVDSVIPRLEAAGFYVTDAVLETVFGRWLK